MRNKKENCNGGHLVLFQTQSLFLSLSDKLLFGSFIALNLPTNSNWAVIFKLARGS